MRAVRRCNVDALIDSWPLLQDFLNGVCTHIIEIARQTCVYYTGNYDVYVKTRRENEVLQQQRCAAAEGVWGASVWSLIPKRFVRC